MANTEELILLIQKEESVWNIDSEDYTQKILKVEAWNRIGEKLTPGWKELSREDQNKTIENLKKKWNHIKKYYKREKLAKKIYYSKRKSEYVERRKYVFNNILGFLDPSLGISRLARQRVRTQNLLTKNVSNTEAKVEITESSQESQDILDNFMTVTTQIKQDAPDPLITRTPPRCKSTSTESLITQIPSPNYHQHLNTLNPQTRPDIPAENFTAKTTQQNSGFLGLNPNEAFLLSCAQEMDEMTPYQRIEFKCGVMNLLKVIKYPVKIEMN